MNNIGNITFIGTGRMATAIAGGLLKNGFPASKVKAYDISDAAAKAFKKVTGVTPYSELATAIDDAEIVILAVKPQSISSALNNAAPYIKEKVLLSIVAGVKIKTLVEKSGCEKVIRVMPNTPSLVGAGISAFTPSSYVSDEEIKASEMILSSIGEYCLVNEAMMDAVTGLSGSGPAYVFDFIQALADGGVFSGLPRDIAQKLAAQTVLGAAKMVIETQDHPSILRDQVISPAGTTAKALESLGQDAFKGTVSKAVIAATERSKELGKEFEN